MLLVLVIYIYIYDFVFCSAERHQTARILQGKLGPERHHLNDDAHVVVLTDRFSGKRLLQGAKVVGGLLPVVLVLSELAADLASRVQTLGNESGGKHHPARAQQELQRQPHALLDLRGGEHPNPAQLGGVLRHVRNGRKATAEPGHPRGAHPASVICFYDCHDLGQLQRERVSESLEVKADRPLQLDIAGHVE